MSSRKVNLSVNGQQLEIDYFVQGFVDHTTAGILAGLKSTKDIKTLEIKIEGDKITIHLNDDSIPLNPFASQIARNTIIGMVSSLKGVSEIKSVSISMRR